MSTNILVLLMLSALISGTAAVLAWMGGWGLIGAFLVYSLGGSMTLFLLAGVARLDGLLAVLIGQRAPTRCHLRGPALDQLDPSPSVSISV